MPRPASIANWFAAVVWLSVLSLAVGLLFLFDDNPRPRQFALPFMFWTFYGVLLVAITVCAIALPMRHAVFCRALVLSQLALTVQSNHYWGTVFERLLKLLSRAQRQAFYSTWSEEWMREAIGGLTYLAIGLVGATVAWAVVHRWPDAARSNFQFRLMHLFVLSAFVAVSLAAVRADNQLASDLVIYASAVLRLVAVVVAATNRPAAVFCWGYLAGDFGWCLLVNSHALEVEWDGFMRQELEPFQRMHLLMRWLLPMYAGVTTGIFSVLMYRPPAPTEKPHETSRGL